jgi:hypothetical protein
MMLPNNPNEKCGWCGVIHAAMCPRVKAIEYESGLIKRVEFHEGQRPASLQHQINGYGYGYVRPNDSGTAWVSAS